MNRTEKITKREMIDAQKLFTKPIFKKEIAKAEKIENKNNNVENIFVKKKHLKKNKH
jgi:hypothetical protein